MGDVVLDVLVDGVRDGLQSADPTRLAAYTNWAFAWGRVTEHRAELSAAEPAVAAGRRQRGGRCRQHSRRAGTHLRGAGMQVLRKDPQSAGDGLSEVRAR